VSTDARDIPGEAFAPGASREPLIGRVTIGRRCRVVPIECVVRGYLEGSGWKDYQKTGAVCGVRLPAGLTQCSRLPEPIFTPATKAPQGEHDENITFERAYALQRGIIIADTKFEFGIPDDGSEPILIDEALTPDSSRFWPADDYKPGRAQASFDKQYLREHLQAVVDRGDWDKRAPGPELPPEVVERTLAKYVEARDRLVAR
jgi:phosphoribosylaminoimidazole-succinocarboxamide synthase